MSTFNREIIKKLIKAIDIKKGQIVLLQFWGDDEDRETLHSFSYEIAGIGATPLEIQHSRKINAEIFNNAIEGCYNEKYYKIFDNVDIVIDICMYRAVTPAKELMKEKFDMYRAYMGTLFKTLTKKEKFIQLRIPTAENSLESGLEPEVFIEKMNLAYDIDYDELKNDCSKKIEEVQGKPYVTVKTGKDCVLTVELGDRKWFVDAGDGDLPCGEIGIAPIENKTNGSVYFERLFLDIDVIADNVTLNIENGKIVSSNSDVFNEFLAELPPNGDVICELGIGMNKNVKSLSGYIVLDEKMYGTFHLGIGMNTLFGGTNECVMHTDFVGNGELIFK